MEQRHIQPEETPLPLTHPNTSAQQPEAAEQAVSGAIALSAQTTPLTPSPLTTLLQQETRSRRREQIYFGVLSGMFFVAIAWITSHLNTYPDPNFARWMGLWLGWAYGVSIFLYLLRRSYRRKRALTQAIEQSRDIKEIGPLVQTLRVENTQVRNVAKQMLIKLLPTMQSSDSELLGGVERDILLRQLSISPSDTGYRDLTELFSRSALKREIDLRLSILKALEQVGGAKELPVVERLSRGRPTLNSAANLPLEVRDAAQQCLPFLQSRATEQLASRQLLRASSAAATTGDLLLRPATAASTDAADQLVRATDRLL